MIHTFAIRTEVLTETEKTCVIVSTRFCGVKSNINQKLSTNLQASAGTSCAMVCLSCVGQSSNHHQNQSCEFSLSVFNAGPGDIFSVLNDLMAAFACLSPLTAKHVYLTALLLYYTVECFHCTLISGNHLFPYAVIINLQT